MNANTGRFPAGRGAFRLLLLAAVCVLPGARAEAQPPGRIFLVTIDTLRADHVGCYGYPRETTPFLDRLRQSGALFSRAYTTMATTGPAHASILTGLYPLEHKVRRNGQPLHLSLATLPELLSANGYYTAAFTSSRPQFDQETFSARFDEWSAPEERSVKGGQTITRVLEALPRLQRHEKLFVWVHLFDPHTPYEAPRSFIEALRDSDSLDRGELFSLFLDEHKAGLEIYGDDPSRMLETMDGYDAEIRFADAQLERLYEHAETLFPPERSCWIVTSDHGEGLGSHDWAGHSRNIYEEQLLVPLIVVYPALESTAPRTVDELVSLADLAPTILDLAEIPESAWPPNLAGRSLLPLLNDTADPAPPREFLFAERRSYDPDSLDHPSYEAGEKFGLIGLNHKLIHNTEGETELFDLLNDPRELDNLAAADAQRAGEMRDILQAEIIRRKEAFAHLNDTAPSEETLEELEALGYIR